MAKGGEVEETGGVGREEKMKDMRGGKMKEEIHG